MTSENLYFKLLWEDFKRRTWAIALVFLGFFFALPVKLALTMENAASTNYYFYNGYKDFVDGTMAGSSLGAPTLLALKTKVVLSEASFGNGLIAALLIVAAVVIGVSGFSYLHHKRQTDFYHSIPVRREILYCVQYTGSIFIVALSYLVNLILTLGVALSYGVGPGSILGPMAGSFGLNMLFFLALFGAMTVAMMMTGNKVVGLLGAGVLNLYIPALMLLLIMYCSEFFLTTSRNLWTSDASPFIWAMKFLSPMGLYITALSWKAGTLGRHVPELIWAGFGALALFFLGLQLYRRRPSEAAGKAMAFRKTMMPIRVLLVLGCGLAGGIFFWALQSSLGWGLFGLVVAIILTHCVVEIIYHFDFKRLFGHKVQLALSLAAGVLIFLGFFYDWLGYDSYVPKADQVAWASMDISLDSNWLGHKTISPQDDGTYHIDYEYPADFIEQNMKIRDMDLVMPFVEEGRRDVGKARKERLEGRKNQAAAAAVQAEGPASVFAEGKPGTQDAVSGEPEYRTMATVTYHLKNGRRASRTYRLYLSQVMDTYEKLYNEKEYKTGLYSILSENPQEPVQVHYEEAGNTMYATKESSVSTELLKAYQADLMDLDTKQRMEEIPIGGIFFITKDITGSLDQALEDFRSAQGGASQNYSTLDFFQEWPVYPSFKRTIQVLESQGVSPGTYFTPDHVKEVDIDVRPLVDRQSGLPQGEALARLQKKNPYYRSDGFLQVTAPGDIRALMDDNGVGVHAYYRMNPFFRPGKGNIECKVYINNAKISGVLMPEQITPEQERFFVGIP